MAFLIGVCVLIVFVVGCYLFIKIKVRRILNQAGFSGMDLGDVIREARLEDENTPKSLASMERILLKQIKKDFPDLNIHQMKKQSEKVILDCYNGIEDKSSKQLKGKLKSFVEDKIRDYKDSKIHYNDIHFHNTVITDYKKEKGVATISFASAFQYYFVKDGHEKKVQDRVKTEYVYVIDEEKLDSHENVIGVHCPNCGSPIKSLGEKTCSYCGSAIQEVIPRVFICNDIIPY